MNQDAGGLLLMLTEAAADAGWTVEDKRRDYCNEALTPRIASGQVHKDSVVHIIATARAAVSGKVKSRYGWAIAMVNKPDYRSKPECEVWARKWLSEWQQRPKTQPARSAAAGIVGKAVSSTLFGGAR
jgi:hypothetical protein